MMFESLRDRPLLGLLGLVFSLLAWTVSDVWAEQRSALDQRKATAVRLLSRDALVQKDELRHAPEAANAQRESLLQRLRIDEGLETARARIYYELREHCVTVKLSCTIRLAEPVKESAVAGTGNEAGTVEALGLQRVRVQVSGSLGDQGIDLLIHALAEDRVAQWRIKQVQLRGRAFELDIERHFVNSAADQRRNGDA